MEYVFGDFYLESFQNRHKELHQLNKYDQFYRVVGQPLIFMHIREFIDKFNELIGTIREETEDDTKMHKLSLQYVPYVRFIDHFKSDPKWKDHLEDIESAFMRLLQIENLFFVKYILNQKKGTSSMMNTQATPNKPDVFTDDSSMPSRRNVLQDVKFDRNTS